MKNLEFGYWYLLEKEEGDNKSLTNVKDYQGQEMIRLAITQLDVTAKEQSKIVNEWCNFLANEKTNIKTIFVGTRISQKIFDAICMQRQLEGLWIKWGVYPSIKNIENLASLKYLHLGGGGSIEDISMVESLSQLVTFESSHLYKISDYNFLAKLTNIIDLLIEGDPYGSIKKVKIKSLKFLEQMPQIVRLSLSMTTIEDHSYFPITKIKSLRHLELPNDKDLQKDMHHFDKFFD